MVKKQGKTGKSFSDYQFKPSVRESLNLSRLSDQEIRSEYTRQARTANKRIAAIEKAGLYSPALRNLRDSGVTRFGLKNQNLTSKKEISQQYRELMRFLNQDTSTKTGIKKVSDDIIKNFNLKFDGNYIEFNKKQADLFDIYDDLQVMAQKGQLKTSDKYDIIHDLDTLYEAGVIDRDTSLEEIVDILNRMKSDRDVEFNQRQNQLNFHWRVGKK